MKKNGTLLFLLLAGALVTTVSGPGTSFNTIANPTAEWSDIELLGEYSLGGTFNVPEITYAGVEVTQSSITYPDGHAVTSKSIPLSQFGKYKLNYYYKDNDNVANKSFSFLVRNRLITASSSDTTFEYTTYEDMGAGDKAKENAKYKNTGIYARIAKGDSLRFNKPINVKSLTKEIPICQVFAVPTTQGIHDVDAFIFTLTDSTDENIYVRFAAKRWVASEAGFHVTYLSGSGNGQMLSGLADSDQKIHVNEVDGTVVYHCFRAQEIVNADGYAQWSQGNKVNVAPNAKQFTVNFDYSENALYTTDITANRSPKYICDLDSTDFSTLWQGFKSDKAYLSISGSNYNAKTAGIMITDVVDTDLSVDQLAPEEDLSIVVDTSYDLDNMPDGKVGNYYEIPKASAYSDSGERQVKAYVEFDYLSGSPKAVTSEGNKFKINQAGLYRIVYEAEDAYGNVYYKYANIIGRSELPSIQVLLTKSEDTTLVGRKYYFEAPTLSGGSGNISYEITAKKDGKEIKCNKDYFIPEEVGEWTIAYEAKDYAGQEKVAYLKLNVEGTNERVITDSPVLPKFIFANSNYVLPTAIANDYSAGHKVEYPCDVEVEVAGNKSTFKDGEQIKITNANNRDVAKITYVSQGARSETVEVPVIVPTNDDHRLNLANYFYGAEENISLSKSSADFIAKEDSNIEFVYANTIHPNGFGVTISNLVVNKVASSELSSFEIKLTDAHVDNLTAQLDIKVNSNTIDFITGNKSISIQKKFNTTGSLSFTIEYSKGNFVINGTALPVVVDAENAPFNGFESNEVYFSMTANNVKADNGFSILELCGSKLSKYVISDNTPPVILVDGASSGKFGMGHRYTVAKAEAFDLFALKTEVTVTVTLDGEPVRDSNGLLLDKVPSDREYLVMLTSYGIYSVQYEAREVDWVLPENAEAGSLKISLECVDMIAPTITIISKEEINTNVKVGDVVTLPAVSVVDDVSTKDKIEVDYYLFTPTGQIINMNKYNAFEVIYEGEYTVAIIATDESGNSSLVDITYYASK